MSFLDFLGAIAPTPFRRNTSVNKAHFTGSDDATIYPSDLFTPGNEPYILFFVRDGVARTGPGNIKARMALYMPPTVKVAYQANWDDGVQLKLNQILDAGASLKNAVSDNATDANIVGAAIQAANVVGLDDGSLGQQLKIENGLTINPHLALLYNGPGFRSFNFTFQLMARNKGESIAIQQLIQKFKEAMHPAEMSGNPGVWTFPHNFDIGLFSPTQDYLFQLTTCVLTNMDVDYAGSGVPSFFTETGAPVDIRLNLTFQEQEILTRERIKQGY